jgi:hypothetical protein
MAAARARGALFACMRALRTHDDASFDLANAKPDFYQAIPMQNGAICKSRPIAAQWRNAMAWRNP